MTKEQWEMVEIGEWYPDLCGDTNEDSSCLVDVIDDTLCVIVRVTVELADAINKSTEC